MAAAQRGIWTGTELRCLLAERAGLELSAASVSALFTKQPSQVKLSTLCVALDCTPGDLLTLRESAAASISAAPSPRTAPDPASPPPQRQSVPRHRSLPPL
ncbi:helix-turn-helix domain-containing protein [Streptomyces sp. NPDC001709]